MRIATEHRARKPVVLRVLKPGDFLVILSILTALGGVLCVLLGPRW